MTDWSRLAESGSMGAIRFMGWFYRVFGRAGAHLLLYPTVAYFFVRDGATRRASRLYLERVWEHPAGRAGLGRRPGPWTPFRHLFEFATQLVDRMVAWSGRSGIFQFEHRGGERLLALAREGRGAILLGSHLGSFDMARQLADRYVTLNVVMFTAHAERINRFFERLDPESRVRVIPLDPGSVQTAFEIRRCLERGELVGMLADRVPAGGREEPVEADFLGRPAPFPLSPFRLACLLGCPVLVSTCVRTGRARYETVVEPLTEGRRLPRRDRDKGAEELARAYVRHLEAACLRYPLQWFNFYDVWRREAEA